MPSGQGNLTPPPSLGRGPQSSGTLVGGKGVQQSVNSLSSVIGGQLHKDFLSLVKAIRDLDHQLNSRLAWGSYITRSGLEASGINKQGLNTFTPGGSLRGAIAHGVNNLLGVKGNGGQAPQSSQQGGLSPQNIVGLSTGLLRQRGNGGHAPAQPAQTGGGGGAGSGAGGGGNNNGGIIGGTPGGGGGQYGGKGNGGLPSVSQTIGQSIYGKASAGRGEVAASWLMHAGKNLAKYGQSKIPDQMMMEIAAVGASYGESPVNAGVPLYGYSNFNYNVFGKGTKPRSEGAFSTVDALQAELARARASGGIGIYNGRDASFDKAWRSLSTANPWMSAEDSAQAVAELTQPSNQRVAMSFPGLGELYNKDHEFVGMGEFTKRFLNWTYGEKRASEVSPGEFFAGTAQGGSVANNFKAFNMSDKSKAGMIMFMEQYLTARSHGMKDMDQFEGLMKSATTADDPNHDQARETLRKYGIETKTNLQLEKDKAATERGFDSQNMKEFNDSLRVANEQIVRGGRVWKEFLDAEPFKSLYQFSAWWGRFLKDPWKMLLGGAEAVGKDPMIQAPNAPPLGGGEIGGLSGLWGGWNVGGASATHTPGGASPDGPKPMGSKAQGKGKTKDAGGPSGSVGAVISAALAQKGTPYSWGGGGIKGPSYGIEQGRNIFGFDCSSLVQYAYWQGAHVNIGRTTWDQMRTSKGRDVSMNDVQPGDLIFNSGGTHVMMWIGGGYVHAPHTGDVVRTVKGKPRSIGRVRRFLGGRAGAGEGLGDDAFDNSAKGRSSKGTGSVAGGLQQEGSGGVSAASSALTPVGTVTSDELEVLAGLMGTDLALPRNQVLRANDASGLGTDPGPSGLIGDNSQVDAVQPGGALNEAGRKAGWLGGQQTSGVLKGDTEVKGKRRGKPDKGGPFKRDQGHPSTFNYTPEGAGPADRAGNKSLAQGMLRNFGWNSKAEWDALDKLWTRESGWNQYADNAISDAYGIPQALPGTKMRSAGSDWRTNPATQIKWGLGYIKGRYGDPLRAWSHSQATGWYDTGSWDIPHDQMAVVHKGEMIIPAAKAQTIREEVARETSSAVSPSNGTQITFGPGSVIIQLGPGATEDMATKAADKFFEQMERRAKYARIAQGV